MFHWVLLCSMSKTLCWRQKKKHLPVCRACIEGIVHLHHTDPLAEQMGEEDVESSENVKNTWSRPVHGGISRSRGCTPICTRNLHQSEGAAKQTFQRCMRSQCHWPAVTQGSKARECSLGWCCLPGCFFVCELLAGIPKGKLASVCEGSRPRVCMSNRLIQACSALCLTQPPEILVF